MPLLTLVRKPKINSVSISPDTIKLHGNLKKKNSGRTRELFVFSE